MRIVAIRAISFLVIGFYVLVPTPGVTADLPPDEWPKTVAEAVSDILQSMTDPDKEELRKTALPDLILFHHGWGTGIRNRYGLWRGNIDLLISACGRPCHPDDASMLIIEAVWSAVQR
jgi:hypothetical protein